MSNPELVAALGVLGLACVTAAWLDLKFRRIPNWLCVATAATGLVAAFWFGSFPALGSHVLHMFAALVGGMLLFGLGVFGGGDAKFYAAVAAWFALGKAWLLMMAVAMCGLVLLIVWFTYRRLAGYPVRKKDGAGFDGLPYGIAIGAGAMAVLLV
jgi:prepilin peptidase CpaA